MDLPTKQRPTDIANRLVVASGEGGGNGLGVWDWQMQTITFRMNKQWILLYSTENYTNSPGKHHEER